MAGAFTQYTCAKFLDHIDGKAAFASLATTYLAAFTANPGASGGGTEASYASYARTPMVGGSSVWTAAAIVSNLPTITNGIAPVNTPAPSSGSAIITAVAAFDALTSGNMIWYAILANSFTVAVGSPLTFPIGLLVVTLPYGTSSGGLPQNVCLAMLNHITGRVAYTQPTGQQLTLYSTVPNPSVPNNGTEQAYTNFVRVATAASVYAAATTATPSVVATASQVNFASNGGGSAATVAGVGLLDGAGNPLIYDSDASQLINVGVGAYLPTATNLFSLQ